MILDKLLKECLAIKDKYNQDNKRVADQFNIFRITSIDRKETKTHTPILQELLDSNGSHGQGNLFFREFLSRLSGKGIIDKNEVELYGNSKYFCEKERRHEEGQLDIKIYCNDVNSFCFIIENKIDAQDGDDQLGRYWEHLEKNHPSHKKLLIYLTPTGSKPSDGSISSTLRKKLEEDRMLHYMSYLDIKEWLSCASMHVEANRVKSLLEQYIEIISEIGGRRIMTGIQSEYLDLVLNNDDYIRAAIDVYTTAKKVKENIAIDFIYKIVPIFQKELGEDWDVTLYGDGNGINFIKNGWSRPYHHIEFDGCNFLVGASNNEYNPLLNEGWVEKQEFKDVAIKYVLKNCQSGNSWLWFDYTWGKYTINLEGQYVDNLLKYKNMDEELKSYYLNCIKDLVA